MKIKRKPPSQSTVWKKCSEYNRRKDADESGRVACCCCGKVQHWKQMDAGHFIPKAKGKGVYFQPENIFAQCRGCNCPYSSADIEQVKIKFTIFMVDRYGEEVIEQLQRKSRQIQHETDLTHWNAYYTQELKKLPNQV